MGAFAYLINTDTQPAGSPRERPAGTTHVRLEGPRYVHPLAWICCFRAGDLTTCTIETDDGSTYDLPVPVTSAEQAIANLTASWPRYLRLVGDEEAAREHWELAVRSIRSLPYRFIALDVADFDVADPAQAAQFAHAFAHASDPLSGADDLFEYERGVLPDRSQHNANVLHCQDAVPATAAPNRHAERQRFEMFQANAANGDPHFMLALGLAYLKGEGTPKDVEAGLKWCWRVAQRGRQDAIALLHDAYTHGTYGAPIDPVKAAEWKGLLKKR